MAFSLSRGHRSPSDPRVGLAFVFARGATANIATLEPRSAEYEWPIDTTITNRYSRLHVSSFGKPVGYFNDAYRYAGTTTAFDNVSGIDALGLDQATGSVRVFVMTADDLLIAGAAHGAGPLSVTVESTLDRAANIPDIAGIVSAEFSPDARKLAVVVWVDARASTTNGLEWTTEEQSEIVVLEAVRATNGAWAWTEIEREPEPIRDDVTVLYHHPYARTPPSAAPGEAAKWTVTGVAEHRLTGNRPLAAGYNSAGSLTIARLIGTGVYYCEGSFVGTDPDGGGQAAAYWVGDTGSAPSTAATARLFVRTAAGAELDLFTDTSVLVQGDTFPNEARSVRVGERRYGLLRGVEASRRVACAWELSRTHSQNPGIASQEDVAEVSALRGVSYDGTPRDGTPAPGAAFDRTALINHSLGSLDLNNGDQGTTDARAFPLSRDLLRSDLRTMDNRLLVDGYGRWMAGERITFNANTYEGVLSSHGEHRVAPLAPTEALTGAGYTLA